MCKTLVNDTFSARLESDVTATRDKEPQKQTSHCILRIDKTVTSIRVLSRDAVGCSSGLACTPGTHVGCAVGILWKVLILFAIVAYLKVKPRTFLAKMSEHGFLFSRAVQLPERE